MCIKAKAFIEVLAEEIGEPLEEEPIDGTHVIESDHFSFTFVLDPQYFEIRTIDTRGNSNIGHRIIHTIHAFADEYELIVFASNVRQSASGFWRKMGYTEGCCSGEFFRC